MGDLKRLVMAGALIAALSTLAVAQDAEVAVNAQFGQWIVSCDAVTVNTNICRLVQEQVLRDSGDLVARFIVQPTEDESAVLLAQVPIAVFLAGGAVYRLEGDDVAPQREMIWQRCAGPVCEAALLLEPDELAAMNDAGAILFGYRTGPTTDPVITRVDMTDFTTGLDAIR